MGFVNVQPEVPYVNQPTASICWLACLQMLYLWKGRPKSEPLDKLNADPDVWPDYWLQNGIAPENCLTIARCLGFVHAGGEIWRRESVGAGEGHLRRRQR